MPTSGIGIVQGQVMSRQPPSGSAETFTAFVSDTYYDRCDPEIMFSEIGVSFDAEASTGTHDAGYRGFTPRGPVIGGGTVQITSIGPGGVFGFASFDTAPSGPFALDSCGLFGAATVEVEPCAVPPVDLTSAAISGQGRVATADFDNVVRVYERTSSASGCAYELAPAYGEGGTLTFGSITRLLAFDADERLYASTEPGTFVLGTTGSFVRVTPDGSVESCLNRLAPSAGLSDSAATEMVVLRDGSLLYASWGFGSEVRIDLSSGALGDGSVPCDQDYADDGEVRYAGALSAHDDGFLFLRALDPVDGPIHAEVTTLELEPELRFGGTVSGYGTEGFRLTGAGSRCPAGYCMASDLGLTIFSDDGAYTDFVNWVLTLPGARIDRALDAAEGDGESFVLLETSEGLNGVRVTAVP